MLRYFESQHHGAQVCDLAEEFYWRLPIAVLQFSIGRTHIANRVEPAAYTLGQWFLSFLFPHSEKKLFRPLAHASLADVIGLLVRQHTDAHVAVGIEGEGLDPGTARINHIVSGT